MDRERGILRFSEGIAPKIVSLLLALILWITILGLKKEELEKDVKLQPLLPPGMMITNKIPDHIKFRLSGPRIWLKEAERRITPIQPDLRNTSETTIGFAVSEDLLVEKRLPKGVKVVYFSPPNILIRLEEVIERYVPVRASLEGSPFSGFEVGNVRVNPSKVAVSGPKSLVNSLEAVGTDAVDVQDLKGAKEVEIPVSIDAQSGLRLSREQVVKVRVSTRPVSTEGN